MSSRKIWISDYSPPSLNLLHFDSATTRCQLTKIAFAIMNLHVASDDKGNLSRFFHLPHEFDQQFECERSFPKAVHHFESSESAPERFQNPVSSFHFLSILNDFNPTLDENDALRCMACFRNFTQQQFDEPRKP